MYNSLSVCLVVQGTTATLKLELLNVMVFRNSNV